MTGILLILVPTIMYGGITILGILTEGIAGMAPGGLELNETQYSLWRAGHAHAAVIVILSLVIQILVDATKLSKKLSWLARISAPVAAVAISGGFFGLAFLPGFKWLLYVGVLSLVVSLLVTGIGLLKNLDMPKNA
ncbi:MAG: hypothetical protein U5J63_00250 [Fodinibius sp.]|nr:hypothetical protein [Fodinibius sp.]